MKQTQLMENGVDEGTEMSELQPKSMEQPSHAHVAERKTELKDTKVLVVEDERDLLVSIARRLKHAGCEVQIAGDGASATIAAYKFHPDVVIMDIGIPNGDGFEVTERLKNYVATTVIPVIFLTARTSDDDRAKAEELNAFAYITKPFKSEELLSTVMAAVGRK